MIASIKALKINTLERILNTEKVRSCLTEPLPDGDNLLHLTVKQGERKGKYKMGKLVRIIEILVAFGMDINARNRNGNAPLHLVRQVKTAKALVENGAKLDVRNSLNRTPAEHVKTYCEKGYEDEKACMVNEWFTLLLKKRKTYDDVILTLDISD